MPSQLVVSERNRCQDIIPRYFNPEDDGSGNWTRVDVEERLCPPHFDRTFCWDPWARNSTQERECPFTFCPGCDIPDRYVRRDCQANGTWTPPDYSACIRIYNEERDCIVSGCNQCTEPFRETVKLTVISLCVLSIILPTIAFIVFVSLKAIQCRRLTIHIHLVVSFIFRFVFFLAFSMAQHGVFNQCHSLVRETQPQWEWLCKALLFLLMYFQLASVFWMFVEGGFLVSRFTVFAMRNTDGPFLPYLLVGWGVPLVQMLLWLILTETLGTGKYCYLPFTESDFIYILVGPMGIALVANFLFLLTVIGILIQKLRAESTAESQRIWKTIKATILLVPLLGIANILLFYEPEGKPSWRNTYQLISAILQHSQGASVAILYCFANAEVQRAIHRVIKQNSWFQRYNQRRPKRERWVTGKTEATTLNGDTTTAVRGEGIELTPSPVLLSRTRTPDGGVAEGGEREPLASARSIPHIDD